MATFIHESDRVSVPGWVTDIQAFRRWANADDFPETGRICWLAGEVWVDMSAEQLFSHLVVKNEFTYAITSLIKAGFPGLIFPDGLRYYNVHADFAGNPDATFISARSLEMGDVRLIEGKHGGYVEVEGSPDMVLEVVSRGSVSKDTVVLKKAYWEAGVKEYWLVDARKEPPRFDVFRHTARGYVSSRKQDGWVRSVVFGKSFRLTQTSDALGHPTFALDVR